MNLKNIPDSFFLKKNVGWFLVDKLGPTHRGLIQLSPTPENSQRSTDLDRGATATIFRVIYALKRPNTTQLDAGGN